MPNFPDGAWACMTINFGPKTQCLPHTDFRNLAFGWCAITALGNFDCINGGQLILWDLKLVATFPSGSTVLIPSAIITHSNCPISDSEHRYSVTQFCAADLFRWVENGFKNDCDIERNCTPEEKLHRKQAQKRRWQEGVLKYSTYKDLSQCT